MATGATPEGTQRYLTDRIDEGLPPSAFRPLGRIGWKSSALGFGSYRIDDRTPAHKEALEAALKGGCNLIDTSSNYGDGESEQLIGRVLKEGFANNTLRRDELIVVSKVGYVQGSNLRRVLEEEKEGHPLPDMVKYAENCWHCIHPDFISDQLSRSLERLQLERIDIYLLHNPEYYLMDTINRNPEMRLDKVRDIFYDRIKRAFRRLEEEVDAGRIAHYGVSSNTFGMNVHEKEATSVSLMWDIACHVAKDRSGNPYQHHFSVVQLPANLLEVGPMLEANNEDEKTAIEFAKDKELALLVNRPLNAIDGNQMVRLADLKVSKIEQTVYRQVKIVCQLEEEFQKKIAPNLQIAGNALKTEQFFRWGHELSLANLKSVDLEQWKQLELQVIRPQISQLSQILDKQLKDSLLETWKVWRDQYLPQMVKLLEIIRNDFSKQTKKQIRSISQKVNSVVPETLKKEPLSRKSLALLVNFPGITCVLNGMRQPKYVKDSLSVLKFPTFPVGKENFQAIAGVGVKSA